jgi:hypothetical protein
MYTVGFIHYGAKVTIRTPCINSEVPPPLPCSAHAVVTSHMILRKKTAIISLHSINRSVFTVTHEMNI